MTTASLSVPRFRSSSPPHSDSSPLIDLGPVAIPTFPGNGFDQRGNPYVREYEGRSDIGAFETQVGPEPSTTSTSTTTTPAGGDPGVPEFTG